MSHCAYSQKIFATVYALYDAFRILRADSGRSQKKKFFFYILYTFEKKKFDSDPIRVGVSEMRQKVHIL